jgi:hypothetical protein
LRAGAGDGAAPLAGRGREAVRPHPVPPESLLMVFVSGLYGAGGEEVRPVCTGRVRARAARGR